MNLTVSTEEFNLLRDLIRGDCGIDINDNKTYLIESRLTHLVVETGSHSFMEFYEKAKGSTDTKLRDKIVDAITTNETLWFRDQSPFIALKEAVFPQLFEALSKGKLSEIRIWSCACSTGQEPYSIAMTADQFASENGYSRFLKSGQFKILATDVSSSALMLARLCRYDQLAMSRGLPDDYRERYFTQQNNVYVLNDTIKNMVTFQKFNVMDPFTGLGQFNIVFLRNVAIYFADDFKKELMNKVASVIVPDGYFFLGASEFFRNSQEHFTACDHERCHFYQRKAAG